MCGIAGDDAVESRLARDEHVHQVRAHLPQRAGEEEVETAPAVNEYSCELDLCYHRVQNQREFARLREAGPLVIM
jgi:hypothetical protein